MLVYLFKEVATIKNQIIFKEHEESDNVYIVLNGVFTLAKDFIMKRENKAFYKTEID